MHKRINPTPIQIRRWIETYTARHKKRKTTKHGMIYLIDNPMITGDSGLHLGISETGWVRDFRPQYSNFNSSFLKFVMSVNGISFKEAVSLVCGNDIKYVEDEALDELRNRNKELPEEKEIIFDLPKNTWPIADKRNERAWDNAVKYLESRAISLEEAKELDLMYGLSTICFPYYEYGMLVYWQQRSIYEKKYMFPEADQTGRQAESYLYGVDRVNPRGLMITTEGLFDKIAVGHAAVGTGGAELKELQVKRILAMMPNELILAPDNDPAGIMSMRKNHNKLSPYFGKEIPKVFYCIPPDPYKDWNEYAQKNDGMHNKNVCLDYIHANKQILDTKAITRLTIPIGRRAHDRSINMINKK